MDCFRARLFRRVDQRFDVEVALAGGRRADADGLVGVADVEGALVSVGVDGDGGHPELLAGTHDAKRDLPAIRHQNLLEHTLDLLRTSHDRSVILAPLRVPALPQVREAAMAGAAATATSAATTTLIRSKTTKGSTPAASAAAGERPAITESQVAPRA